MDIQAMNILAEATGNMSNAFCGAAIGCGLSILGVGIGIGMLGGKALEATARQPSAGGRIFTLMIIAASLLEGVSFFSLIICFLLINWLR